MDEDDEVHCAGCGKLISALGYLCDTSSGKPEWYCDECSGREADEYDYAEDDFQFDAARERQYRQ